MRHQSLVKITDPDAGMLWSEADDKVGPMYDSERDTNTEFCNIETPTIGNLATDAHDFMTTWESDLQAVDWALVPDIWALKTEEKSVVPKPAPVTDKKMDPLPGAWPGVVRRMAGEANVAWETRYAWDDTEVKEATTSNDKLAKICKQR